MLTKDQTLLEVSGVDHTEWEWEKWHIVIQKPSCFVCDRFSGEREKRWPAPSDKVPLRGIIYLKKGEISTKKKI